MTLFDLLVLAILAASIGLALMRGLIAEVMSLGAWLVSFWCAKQFAPSAAEWLPFIGDSGATVGLLAGFVVVFIVVWVATVLLRLLLTGLIEAIGLGFLNRGLGAVFGAARAGVLVLALVLAAGLTSMPKSDMMRNSLLAPPFAALALELRPWLPQVMASRLDYQGLDL